MSSIINPSPQLWTPNHRLDHSGRKFRRRSTHFWPVSCMQSPQEVFSPQKLKKKKKNGAFRTNDDSEEVAVWFSVHGCRLKFSGSIRSFVVCNKQPWRVNFCDVNVVSVRFRDGDKSCQFQCQCHQRPEDSTVDGFTSVCFRCGPPFPLSLPRPWTRLHRRCEWGVNKQGLCLPEKKKEKKGGFAV